MKQLPLLALFMVATSLSACDQSVSQWLNPDKEFTALGQPDVTGVNDTQESMAKDAAAAGDFKRAAQVYQQLVASRRGSDEQMLRYKFGLAEATRRLGNNDAALAMYEELYREHPENMDIAESRGLTLMAAGKLVEASRAFAEVMKYDARRWRTLNALGILFAAKNMIPEAIAYYNEALANSPNNAAILNNIGLSYAINRNYPQAINALQKAAKSSNLPTRRQQIEMNLAMVYGASGNMEAARTLASRYLQGPALANNLGLYAHLAKDETLAKTYLNMALSQSPTFYERAWENLDMVTDNDGGEATASAAKTRAEATQPKVDIYELPAAISPAAGARPAAAMAPAVKNMSNRAPAAQDRLQPLPDDALRFPASKR